MFHTVKVWFVENVKLILGTVLVSTDFVGASGDFVDPAMVGYMCENITIRVIIY